MNLTKASATNEQKCGECGKLNEGWLRQCCRCGNNLSGSNAAPVPEAIWFNSPQPLESRPVSVSSITKTFKVTVKEGKSPNQTFLLDLQHKQTFTIGRNDEVDKIFPDIDLDTQDADGFVHRRHAVLLYQNNQWWLEDKGGANGTKLCLNGQTRRLPSGGKEQIQIGSEFMVGRVLLCLEVFKQV